MVASFDFDASDVGRVCLVTGGSGYVGGHLIRRLLEIGCEVHSLDIVAFKGDPRVKSHVGDVRDFAFVNAACEGVDTVFHAAALINLLAWYRPSVRRRVFGVNVQGTEHVIRACVANGVGKLIYTSSIAVVGGSKDRMRDETTPYASSDGLYDLYAETKGVAEGKVLAADKQSGLRTASVRPGGVWGPGEGAIMVQQFLQDLARGRFKAVLGSGEAEIDNTHVDNLIDAQFLIAQKMSETPDVVGGQAYFVTDGEPMNGIQWYKPLVAGLGYQWPKIRVPGAIAYRFGQFKELAHFFGAPEPMITRRAIQSLTSQNSFSIDKARTHLGYTPRIQQNNGIAPLLVEYKSLIKKIATSKSAAGV